MSFWNRASTNERPEAGDDETRAARRRRDITIRAGTAVMALAVALIVALTIPSLLPSGSQDQGLGDPAVTGSPSPPNPSPTPSPSPEPSPSPAASEEPSTTPAASPEDALPFRMYLHPGWTFDGIDGARVTYRHQDGSTFTVIVDSPVTTDTELNATHTYIDSIKQVGDAELTWSRDGDFCEMWRSAEPGPEDDYVEAEFNGITFRCDLNRDREGSNIGFYFRGHKLGYPLRGHSYYFEYVDPVRVLPRERIESLFAGFLAR